MGFIDVVLVRKMVYETAEGAEALRQAVAHNADEFARDLLPVLDDIHSDGRTTLRAVADELNARGMLTRRGGQWQVSNVRNLLRRLETAIGA